MDFLCSKETKMMSQKHGVCVESGFGKPTTLYSRNVFGMPKNINGTAVLMFLKTAINKIILI